MASKNKAGYDHTNDFEPTVYTVKSNVRQLRDKILLLALDTTEALSTLDKVIESQDVEKDVFEL